MCNNGILHQTSCIDTPYQNSMTKKKKKIDILEIIRVLLIQLHVHVPIQFWVDALSITCFLINCIPSLVLRDNTPYTNLFPTKLLFHIQPKIFSKMYFFWCSHSTIAKLNSKSLNCVFLVTLICKKKVSLLFSHSQQVSDAH